ncbi:MAG TPA: hypothetical protein VFD93_02220 [Candidatus Acidoferrales bacterium]|nr:hypothetical protein [Candidatus Acidoferrales bacterium]
MRKTATRKRPSSVARKRSKLVRIGGRSRKASNESVAWIRALAAPYLKGYKPVAANGGSLRGYWFLASSRAGARKGSTLAGKSPVRGQATGFFVGYLTSGDGYSFFSPEPPECLVFAWITPVDGALHRRLVQQPGSLVRKTFEYIRWLTHRPPRFVFHEKELPAMARHGSMRVWPPEKHQHLSQNFFIETLAWLVRSGLVRKLKEADQHF